LTASISKLGGAFGIYELLPAFIFSSICIIAVSLLTPAPSAEVQADFDAVKTKAVDYARNPAQGRPRYARGRYRLFPADHRGGRLRTA